MPQATNPVPPIVPAAPGFTPLPVPVPVPAPVPAPVPVTVPPFSAVPPVPIIVPPIPMMPFPIPTADAKSTTDSPSTANVDKETEKAS